ncbi:hypothetical protein [Aquisphaera insulae]|uniref:hypothetical protein n=1 Tax=Aquisphaera insulae TaxID=2712864 RepID=UPI0013EA268B|nr:hypothetical protein [Aquisphaera insulae]
MSITVRTPGSKRVAAFGVGDIVYLRIDDEPTRGMVTGVSVTATAELYHVLWPNRSETRHYDIELAGEFVPEYERA